LIGTTDVSKKLVGSIFKDLEDGIDRLSWNASNYQWTLRRDERRDKVWFTPQRGHVGNVNGPQENTV